MHNLHHQLAGLHGGQHVHTYRLLLHGVSKVFGNLVVDVGIEQRAAHVFQRFSYVNLGDFPLTLQYLERPFQPFA